MARDRRPDGELIAAVAERDRGALEELVARHGAWLSVRLRYRCADPQLCEEVLQDTFVQIWRSAGSYAGSGPVAAWLWGIAVRKLLHALRPRRPLLERLRLERPAAVVASAEEELLLAVEHGDLGVALGGLAPELRAVVQATVLEGLTCAEAGRLLGIPTGTVKTRMMRARRELREALL